MEILLFLCFLLRYLNPGTERLYFKRLVAAEFSRIIESYRYSQGVDAQTPG